ncbi:MAG TPA: DUF5312 family protein, partial [Spirochaetia bacterium]|nr:DUF5312 family protein [Spirochaetia bacterium]
MAVDSVFDRLVGELSTSERQELLTRIRFSEKVSDIPLIDVSGSGSYDFETVYRELTFLERLVLFFKRILTGREYATLVEEIAVKRVGRLLNLKAAGLISTREMELTEGFLEALESLADAAKSFRAPLKSALGIYRREFLAFLAGMELPLVQDELLKETNPDLQGEAQESVSVFDLKRLTEGLVQETFDAISESDRLSMYDHVQCLHALFDLSVFPFDRIANRFTGPEGGRRCPGQPVLGPLKDLAGLLRRLALPPKISVLEALFLFELRDRLNDPETALEGEIDGALRTAERSLAAIRSFNQTVPLVDIIRFITQDCDWTSQPKTGGEDWFVQFKQFWTDRLDERFYVYAALKKQQETVAKAKSLLRLARLPLLSNYRSELFADFGGVAHEHSIAFLLGWTNIIFEKDIGRWVKVFLLDGRFYKEDNR